MRKDELLARLETFDRDFGRRMREARLARGMSQVQLLNILRDEWGFEWVQSVMTKLESGTRPVRFSEAIVIARALNTTTEDLMFGTEYRQSQQILRDNDIRREELRHLRGYVDSRETQIENVDDALTSEADGSVFIRSFQAGHDMLDIADDSATDEPRQQSGYVLDLAEETARDQPDPSEAADAKDEVGWGYRK